MTEKQNKYFRSGYIDRSSATAPSAGPPQWYFYLKDDPRGLLPDGWYQYDSALNLQVEQLFQTSLPLGPTDEGISGDKRNRIRRRSGYESDFHRMLQRHGIASGAAGAIIGGTTNNKNRHLLETAARNGYYYEVDFDHMIQRNITTGKERPIWRTCGVPPSPSFVPATHWKPPPPPTIKPTTIPSKAKKMNSTCCPDDIMKLAEDYYQKHKQILYRDLYEDLGEELRADKVITLAAVFWNGNDLEYAPEEYQNDKEIVLVACSRNHGIALRYASEELRNDKEFVSMLCSRNGQALQYASEALRGDKEVVMAAVESDPVSLKFALGGLNQDKDCLVKAQLWDENYMESNTINNISSTTTCKRRIVLSTKFSLAAESSPHATQFTVALKKNPYIASNFIVYSPNAFNKGTCDEKWTNINWPCRGTYSTCEKPTNLKTGVPQVDCCWRYSFRYHLKEAFRSGSFMIQVVDWDDDKVVDWHDDKVLPPDQDDLYRFHTLGDGQKIETEMALEEGIKIFRFFETRPEFLLQMSVDKLVNQIIKWFQDGCSDMSECNEARLSVGWASNPR